MQYENDCPGCGQEDHGWNMPDVRSTLHINNCTCATACQCDEKEMQELGYEPDECMCEVNGCDCADREITIKVVIRRIFDRTCEYCDGSDYRCVYDVKLDSQVVKTVNSEDEADAYIAKVFPTAKPPERDYAWESERGLRIAEGWGC